MTRIILLILGFSTVYVFGQNHAHKKAFAQKYIHRLTNSKANQFLIFSGSSDNHMYYDLVTKTDTCQKITIIVVADRVNSFVDSLKKVGFKPSEESVDITSQYKFNLTIDKISFSKIEQGDSAFTFIYKYELVDKSNHITTRLDTFYVTDKQKVMSAVNNKKYSFSVDRVAETTIFYFTLTSLHLFNADKWAHYQSGSTIGFFF